MKVYIEKTVSYFILWLVIIIGFNRFFSLSYQYTCMMMQEMYHCPENIDVLFLGSSHTYRSYDVALADEMLGVKTFNMGSSGQPLITSYYLLKEAAKQNEIKTVYLDTYFGVALSDVEKNIRSVYYISDYMKFSMNKVEYLWKAGGLEGLGNGILFASRRNMTNTVSIEEKLSPEEHFVGNYTRLVSDVEAYQGDGFVYSYKQFDPIYDIEQKTEIYNQESDLQMNEESYIYLIKIINFCIQNEIELVLVDQPMPDEFLNSIKGYSKYVGDLIEISNQYGLRYLNFNLLKGYKKSLEDFSDVDHLNGRGAEKYTEIFCNTVKAIKSGSKTMDDFFYKEYTGIGTIE